MVKAHITTQLSLCMEKGVSAEGLVRGGGATVPGLVRRGPCTGVGVGRGVGERPYREEALGSPQSKKKKTHRKQRCHASSLSALWSSLFIF